MLGYEISDACTSIVAQTPSGEIYHARNMDFSIGGPLTNTLRNSLINLEFRKGSQLVFRSTTFAGFVGVLTGMSPQGFSATVNTRFYPKGPLQMLQELVDAIDETGYSLVSFLLRDAMTQAGNFDLAVQQLSNTKLIADVYYTVAGTLPDQGVVISRNRTGVADYWYLGKFASLCTFAFSLKNFNFSRFRFNQWNLVSVAN